MIELDLKLGHINRFWYFIGVKLRYWLFFPGNFEIQKGQNFTLWRPVRGFLYFLDQKRFIFNFWMKFYRYKAKAQGYLKPKSQGASCGEKNVEGRNTPEPGDSWKTPGIQSFWAKLWVLWIDVSYRCREIVYTSGNISKISCFCPIHDLESTLNSCHHSTDSENHSKIGSGTFDVPFWPRYVDLCVLLIR